MIDRSIPGPSGPRAGFGRRFAAFLVDQIIIVVAGETLITVLKGPGALLWIVAAAAYYSCLEGGPAGQTLGKRALQIRVVDLDGGGPIGYSRGLMRFLGKIASNIALDVGYLWMLWDPERQTWQDKVAGSVVVPEAEYPIT